MNRMNTGSRLSFLLVLAVGSLAGCSSEQTRTTPSPETVRNIPVLAVQQANVPDLLEAVGTVRAAQTSDAASQMMGNIVEIRAHEGDHVQRGQVLAVIDDSQPRASVDRATAAELAAQQQRVGADSDLALAESTLKRYQTLFEKKSVSPQEFDEVKARQQAALARRDMTKAGQAQAQAALSQARTSLDYTRIRAPFEGLVTEKKADSGNRSIRPLGDHRPILGSAAQTREVPASICEDRALDPDRLTRGPTACGRKGRKLPSLTRLAADLTESQFE
jgi:multidrug efflux system membrane fusion protein